MRAAISLEESFEVWCPRCREHYGKAHRVQQNDLTWKWQTVPQTIRKMCGKCEQPLERKR